MGLKIRGYFSVFGNVDNYGTIFDEGAFSDFLRTNPDIQLPIYWSHDHRLWDAEKKPVGVTTALRQDKIGMYFEGELADTRKAIEVGNLIDLRAIAQASFAFRAQDQYEKDEVWHYAAVEPVEVTVAAIHAANPKAYVEPIPEAA